MSFKKNAAHKRKISWSLMIMRIVLILLTVCSLYPVFFVFNTSFRTKQEFYSSIFKLPQSINFDNYIGAVTDGHIGEYFINSIIITGVALIFVLIFSVLSAYGLSRLKVPGVEGILLLLFICQMLPQESMLIPLYVICSKIGLLKVPFISTIIPYIGWTLSGSIVMLKIFFDTLPVELLEAARIDGCTEWKTMTKVAAPLMKPSICTVMMLAFCGCWGELMWAQQSTLLTDKGIPLTVGLLNFQGGYSTDWGMLTAAVVVILVPLYFIFAFTQKYLVAGFTGGGVKG